MYSSHLILRFLFNGEVSAGIRCQDSLPKLIHQSYLFQHIWSPDGSHQFYYLNSCCFKFFAEFFCCFFFKMTITEGNQVYWVWQGNVESSRQHFKGFLLPYFNIIWIFKLAERSCRNNDDLPFLDKLVNLRDEFLGTFINPLFSSIANDEDKRIIKIRVNLL